MRLIKFVAFFVVSQAALAAIPPPVQPFDAITWKATMKNRPSTGIRMGNFLVQFEKTTLAEVRRIAAVGNIFHRGDAGESIYWLCYTNIMTSHVERIWITASALNGPRHNVSGVNAEIIPNGSPSADCPNLPAHLKPVSLTNGFWLQTNYEMARSRLGDPPKKNGTWQTYDFEGKVSGNCDGGFFDLSNRLMLHFSAGRVDRLIASQATTC